MAGRLPRTVTKVAFSIEALVEFWVLINQRPSGKRMTQS